MEKLRENRNYLLFSEIENFFVKTKPRIIKTCLEFSEPAIIGFLCFT